MLLRALMLNPRRAPSSVAPIGAYWTGTYTASITWDAAAGRLTFGSPNRALASTVRPFTNGSQVGLVDGASQRVYSVNRSGPIVPETATYPIPVSETTGRTLISTDLTRIYSRSNSGGSFRCRDLATGQVAVAEIGNVGGVWQPTGGNLMLLDVAAASPTPPVTQVSASPRRLLVHSYSDQVDSGYRMFGPGGLGAPP